MIRRIIHETGGKKMQREIGLFFTAEQIDLLMQALDQFESKYLSVDEAIAVDDLIEIVEKADPRVNKM
jgi:hypothetical protein